MFEPVETAGAAAAAVANDDGEEETGAGGGRVQEGRLSFDDVQPHGTCQEGPEGDWPGGSVATCAVKVGEAL